MAILKALVGWVTLWRLPYTSRLPVDASSIAQTRC
jgi:hypothetical protein